MAEWGDTADQIEAMLIRSVEFRPDTLFARPSQCIQFRDLLAKWAGAGPISVRVIETFGEVLTPTARSELEEFFGCPVRDLYGMREVGTIAVQCHFGAYHIEGERVWVEVLDDDGRPVPDGTDGDLAITGLINTAMPLVRYRNGDVGCLAEAPCLCGRPQKAMRLAGGRRAGVVILPDGQQIDSFRVVSTISTYPVRRYQLIQEYDSSLIILVNPGPAFTDQDAIDIERHASLVVGDRVSTRVEVCGDRQFHLSKSGKPIDFVSMRRAAKTEPGRAVQASPEPS
jgi:phenylacetate-CoA ligase